MYMAPDSWKQLYAQVLEQVRSSEIAQSRMDDAVRRILRVKALAGLFNKLPPNDRFPSGHLATLGSAAQRYRYSIRRS